jgi:hypothetical protein
MLVGGLGPVGCACSIVVKRIEEANFKMLKKLLLVALRLIARRAAPRRGHGRAYPLHRRSRPVHPLAQVVRHLFSR